MAENRCPVCGRPEGTCPTSTHVFIVENLDCAHCASEMEERIGALDGVEGAELTYTTKQLRVTCPHPEEMRLRFQEVCRTVDGEVLVVEPPSSGGRASAVSDDDGDDDHGDLRRDLITIIACAVVFAGGLVVEHLVPAAPVAVSAVLYLLAYLLAGGKVLLRAARNIRHGRVFDENLLMSVATFGAIAVHQYPEAVGVMLFYRVGELFEDRAVERSRSQIMEAVDLRPETVDRLIDYQVDRTSQTVSGALEVEEAHARRTERIPAAEAAVGDHLLVRPGDRIPLDGVVVEGASRLDTSPVTGEPVPVTVVAGSPVLSGCMNISGMLVLRVERELSGSLVTRILDSVENAAANKPQIQRFITRFAKVYTPVVIGIAVLTAVVPSLITGDWMHWLYTACTFLVISCPCAIVLSVPLSFFAGIGAASKLGVLFKGGNAIEALRGVRAVVMDKTGTITRGEFALREVHVADGYGVDEMLRLAASAEQVSTHPIAVSIVAAARERGLRLEDAGDVQEEAGRGLVARLPRPAHSEPAGTDRGDVQVLCGNAVLLEDHGVEVPAGLADAGTDAGTCVLVAIDGIFAGTLRISDEPKPDSAQAIAELKAQGLRTVMLTGDAPEAAHAVATQVGVDEVRAGLLPQQKVGELRAVREREGAVMFVGDGINDAPVLAGANVGAAMGSGSDAAIEAADVVFMNSSLAAVPQALHIARVVGTISRENIVFALAVKVAIMVLGFAGLASMWAAVFADVGVAMLCILNSIRILYHRY